MHRLQDVISCEITANRCFKTQAELILHQLLLIKYTQKRLLVHDHGNSRLGVQGVLEIDRKACVVFNFWTAIGSSSLDLFYSSDSSCKFNIEMATQKQGNAMHLPHSRSNLEVVQLVRNRFMVCKFQ